MRHEYTLKKTSGRVLYACLMISWSMVSGPGVVPLICPEHACRSSLCVREGHAQCPLRCWSHEIGSVLGGHGKNERRRTRHFSVKFVLISDDNRHLISEIYSFLAPFVYAIALKIVWDLLFLRNYSSAFAFHA